MDLVLVIVTAVTAMGLSLLPAMPLGIRVLLAVALALWMPGYALLAALFPRMAPLTPERLVLSLGTSLAVTILGGLALNLTPWGLQPTAWALFLGGVSVAAAAAALWRRGLSRPAPLAWPMAGLRWTQALLLGLTALLLAGAIGVARLGALNQPSSGFTELWLIPVEAAATDKVRLGIANHNSAPMRYRVELAVAGQIKTWPAVELQPQDQWETIAELPAATGAEPVEARIYLVDEPRVVHRQVWLWPTR